MSYKEKYIKYKKKYLEKKVGGVGNGTCLDNLNLDVVSKIKNFQNCQETIFTNITNKERMNNYKWENLKPIINTNEAINISYHNINGPHVIENDARRLAYYKYINQCRLQKLYKKYIKDRDEPAGFMIDRDELVELDRDDEPVEYTIDILNDIVFEMIPNNFHKKKKIHDDFNFLLNLGCTIRNIPDFAYYNKNLRRVIIPKFIIYIGKFAFYKNQLTNVKIPDSVMAIDKYAFEYNQLTSIEIPDSVIEIGEHAFGHNKLENVKIPRSFFYSRKKRYTDEDIFIHNHNPDFQIRYNQ